MFVLAEIETYKVVVVRCSPLVCAVELKFLLPSLFSRLYANCKLQNVSYFDNRGFDRAAWKIDYFSLPSFVETRGQYFVWLGFELLSAFIAFSRVQLIKMYSTIREMNSIERVNLELIVWKVDFG